MTTVERAPTRAYADALVAARRLGDTDPHPIVHGIAMRNMSLATAAFVADVEAAGIAYPRAAVLGRVAQRYARLRPDTGRPGSRGKDR